MKKEFTEDQLVYIRDIFALECEKYIDLGIFCTGRKR